MNSSTSFLTRLSRLFRLAGWLWYAARKIGRLDKRPSADHQQVLAEISDRLLSILNIHLHIEPQSHGSDSFQAALIVSNHISWLDIFALCAFRPAGFIAKQEIRKWPLIGKLCANIGTVFINRNDRKDIAPVNAAIGTALTGGRSVCFFPEAKTSDGLGLLPFKAALFQSAVDTQMPVCVVALRYLDGNGNQTTLPSYAGDTSLLRSLWNILSMPDMEIRLSWQTIQPPYDINSEARFALKERAEKMVGKMLGLPENASEH